MRSTSLRTVQEKELTDRRKEITHQERRILQKEETVDKKIDNPRTRRSRSAAEEQKSRRSACGKRSR